MAYHTFTWLMWLAAAAYLALANQQPLQAVVLILAVGSVFTVASRRNPSGQSWSAFLRFGVWAWLLALAFNLLFSHAGNSVLLTLPRSWPLIGGPLTLEALLFGLASGANLFAVLLVFATFNLVIDAHRLLRWIPAGLYQAGLVISIALSFVPQMVSGLAEIREAQRIRGHRFRGLRDLIPLFVPLITTALERSLTLAESIEARGFGGVLKGEAMTAEAVTTNLLVGLMALLCGLIWQALRPSAAWVGLVMLACGVALIGLGVHLQGRGVRRTHYRRELWRARDTWVSLACLAAASLATYVRMRDPSALAYYPYPPFSPWPRFTPLLGLAALLSATPAFLWPAPSSRGDRPVAPTVQAGRRA